MFEWVAIGILAVGLIIIYLKFHWYQTDLVNFSKMVTSNFNTLHAKEQEAVKSFGKMSGSYQEVLAYLGDVEDRIAKLEQGEDE